MSSSKSSRVKPVPAIDSAVTAGAYKAVAASLSFLRVLQQQQGDRFP